MAEFDSAIPPGGTGQVVATIKTKGIRGARRKTVRIETNDPERPSAVLTVAFDSKAAVAVMPRELVRLSTRIGRPAETTLVLRREDGEPLEVHEATSSLPGVSVAVSRIDEDGSPEGEPAETPVATRKGDWLVRVSLVDVGAPAEERGVLRIGTNHPDSPLVFVPVRVRVDGPVRAHPRRLVIVAGPGSVPTVSRVSLRHGGRRPFTVVGVRVEGDLPGVEAALVEDGPAPVHTIELSASPADAPLGAFEGHVVATLDLKRAPTLRIPVSLRVESAQEPARRGGGAKGAPAAPPD